jgi:hypothetical protein
MSDTPTIRAETNGVVVWMRSDRDDCICCPGRHVFSHSVVLDDGERFDVARWFYGHLRSLPEGSHLRLTLTLVPSEVDHADH